METIHDLRSVAKNKFTTFPDLSARIKVKVQIAAEESKRIISFLRSYVSESIPPNGVTNTSGKALQRTISDTAVEEFGSSLSTASSKAMRMNQSPVCCIQCESKYRR